MLLLSLRMARAPVKQCLEIIKRLPRPVQVTRTMNLCRYQLTHQPNSDRIFWSLRPPTVPLWFFLRTSEFLRQHIQGWISNLQTEKGQISLLNGRICRQLFNASLPLVRTRWQRKKTKKRCSLITLRRINIFFHRFIRSIWKREKQFVWKLVNLRFQQQRRLWK